MKAEREAIRRILDKLAEVRKRKLTCSGSDLHHYELNPPLDEETIAQFEHKHGIQLPDDYRAFLLLAGNGGAGPYYGLLPLEEWNTAGFEDQPGFLARPSPLRPEMWNQKEREQPQSGSWDDIYQGTLTLVHGGCEYYSLLVVTGEYRGRVVNINLNCPGSPYFVHNPDFLSWYERWLDELLWGYHLSSFGFGLPGREADLVDVLTAGGKPDLRGEALSTLSRIASLRPVTLEVIQSLLSDESAWVRRQACSLLGKHGVTTATADIAARLEDDDPDVREAALAALAKIPGADWEPEARRLLGDSEHSVIFRALCLLKDAGHLRRADVEPLFESPRAKVRSSALWASEAIQGEVVQVPDRLLHDPDREVRHYAYERWGQDNPKRVAVLSDLIRQQTDVVPIRGLVRTLADTGDRTAVPILIEMTRHPDAFVRKYAVQGLGTLKDPRAIPALLELLSDATKPEYRDEDGSISITCADPVSEAARKALEQMESA